MKRFIQFIQLLFSSRLSNAELHYSNPEIVEFYRELNAKGLFDDEVKTIEKHVNSNLHLKSHKLLVIGAGAGRECIAFSDYFENIIAYEPVKIMRESGMKQKSDIIWCAKLEEINEENIDVIWITKNLPSFLTRNERRDLLLICQKLIKNKGTLYVSPDVMPLSWAHTFKYKFASYLLKFNTNLNSWEKGDTVRSNLDFNTPNDKMVYYHYFPSREVFIEELRQILHFQDLIIENDDSGFIKLQFVSN